MRKLKSSGHERRCVLNNIKDSHQTAHQSIDTLQTLVKDISKNFQRIVIVIDGLDELPSHLKDLRATTQILDALSRLHRDIPNLYVAVFCQDTGNIGAQLKPDVEIPCTASHLAPDIEEYINSELNTRTWSDPHLKNEVRENLIQGVDGM